jgi:hypothetical protein
MRTPGFTIFLMQIPARPVANVEHVDHVSTDFKDNTVVFRVNKMAELLLEMLVFRHNGTTPRVLNQRLNRVE